MNRRMAASVAEFGDVVETNAQPCAQPDEPARAFLLVHIGAARRLA